MEKRITEKKAEEIIKKYPFQISVDDISWEENKEYGEYVEIKYNETTHIFKNIINTKTTISPWNGVDQPVVRTIYYGKINNIDAILVNYNYIDTYYGNINLYDDKTWDLSNSGDWFSSECYLKKELK